MRGWTAPRVAAVRGVFHERWNIIGTNRYWERGWAVEPAHVLLVLLRELGTEGGDRTRTTLRVTGC